MAKLLKSKDSATQAAIEAVRARRKAKADAMKKKTAPAPKKKLEAKKPGNIFSKRVAMINKMTGGK